MNLQNTIVVGLDGSPAAWRAMNWAADESARTGRSVLLVHAAVDNRVSGAELLAEGRARLTDGALDVDTRIMLRETDPVSLLLGASEGADLVVLGRTPRRMNGSRLGSVAHKVLTRAACPVVIVDQPVSVSTNVVVVGVPDSPSSLSALDFACVEARLRGATVVAVRARSAHGASRESAAVRDAEEQAIVDSTVQLAHRLDPTVAVRGIRSGESIECALERASADAALVVLGSRSGPRLPRLGPVTSWAVHYLYCPVAVVKTAPSSE
jgi:nucleotide-binding universal stress UspA family protein